MLTMTRSRTSCALCVALCAAACGQSEFGSVWLRVYSDVESARLIDRVRVDVFDSSEPRRLLASPDKRLVRRQSATDPLFSLTLYTDADETEALVRLRAYWGARTRPRLTSTPAGFATLQGEQIEALGTRSDSPLEIGKSRVIAASHAERIYASRIRRSSAAGSAQHLTQTPTTARVAGARFGDEALSLDCGMDRAAIRLGALGVHVDKRSKYRVDMNVVSPIGDWLEYYARPILYLVRGRDPDGEVVGCSARRNALPTAADYSLSSELEAGEYTLLIANLAPGTVVLDVGVFDTQRATVSGIESDLSTGQWSKCRTRRLPDESKGPRTFPDPAFAIDRLVLVRWKSGDDAAVDVTLQRDCLGVEADLCKEQTCVGSDRALTNLDASALEPNDSGAPIDLVMATTAKACDLQRPRASLACVEGEMFVFGDASIATSAETSTVPERVALVDAFYMDRTEFSVGRYRQLVRTGKNIDPHPHAKDSGEGMRWVHCTLESAPDGSAVSSEGEALPLNCVSWQSAQSICRAAGGRLPTSAEWELAASGGVAENVYPWGSDALTTMRDVVARFDVALGPEAPDGARADRTPRTDIQDLGGNLAEWTADSNVPYEDPCWTQNGLRNPLCDKPLWPLRTIRGGSWRDDVFVARTRGRRGAPAAAEEDNIGFRCVYPVSSSGASP